MQYRTVKASERTSQHYVKVPCMWIGHDEYGVFMAYWDFSKKVYIPIGSVSNWILPEEIEWLEPLPESKEQQEEKKTAEEILNKTISKDRNKLLPPITYLEDYAGGSDRYIREGIVESAMEEYAEQSLSSLRQQLKEKDVSRAAMMREKAITCIELTKGFLPEQRDNSIKTIEELSGYILELTNSTTN